MTKKSKKAEDNGAIPDITPTGSKCPICKKPAIRAYRPFCSKRCADVDLGNWVTGTYVIDGEDGNALGQDEEF